MNIQLNARAVRTGECLVCSWCDHHSHTGQIFYNWPKNTGDCFCSFRCAADWMRWERRNDPWRASILKPAVVLSATTVARN